MNIDLDIVAFLSFLATIGFWIYKAWKSRQGRHVVCTQKTPIFSHLLLSGRAREWVEVKYVGGDQSSEPKEIDRLSQIVIDIRNDSDTDALSDVELEFRVPRANVLNVWWEEVPPYLGEESGLAYFPEEDCSADKDTETPWRVRVRLSQLKSFKKYEEVIKVGILANGELHSIEMIDQGSSKPGVPSDQIWTAQFVPYEKVVETSMRRYRWTLALTPIAVTLLVVALIALAACPFGGLGEVIPWLAGIAGLSPITVSFFLVGVILSLAVGVTGKMGRTMKVWLPLT